MKIGSFLTEDQTTIRDLAREFASADVAGHASDVDGTDEFPADLYRRMGELGLPGLVLPEEFGGR